MAALLGVRLLRSRILDTAFNQRAALQHTCCMFIWNQSLSRGSGVASMRFPNAASRPLTTGAAPQQAVQEIGLGAFFENGRALPPAPKEGELPIAYGRAWSADELRTKSFDDLHGLWFVLLREKNLLATQRAEAKRTGLRWPFSSRLFKCRLSMARIKTVLTERASLHKAARTAVGLDSAQAAPQDLVSSQGLTASQPPMTSEGQILADWHHSQKMRMLWRKRRFRKRMNYRAGRLPLFT